jgi:predicted transposase YbfD/YdcC
LRLRDDATAQAPGTHLLAAFSARLQGVIGQSRVAPDANEITAAPRLLKTLPLKGVTITGDAMFTQRATCRNAAPTLIRRLGYKVVEGFEHVAEHRLAAINAVRGQRTE